MTLTHFKSNSRYSVFEQAIENTYRTLRRYMPGVEFEAGLLLTRLATEKGLEDRGVRLA